MLLVIGWQVFQIDYLPIWLINKSSDYLRGYYCLFRVNLHVLFFLSMKIQGTPEIRAKVMKVGFDNLTQYEKEHYDILKQKQINNNETVLVIEDYVNYLAMIWFVC